MALLALRQGRETERAWLAATLWPETEESRGRFYLRRTLSELREALGGGDTLVAEGSSLRLEAQTDLQAFELALRRQDAAAADTLYRGPLLEGWHDDWALVERNRCEQALLMALESQAEIPMLRRVLTLDPLRESAVRALMQALADRGDAAAAQQEFRALRQRLAQQCLGEPDPQTVALARQLKPSTDQPAVKLRLERLPTLSLPLTPLRGRDEDLTLLLGLLRSHRLVTLTGAGGIGKTRLAQEVALESEPRFRSGTIFVDLSALKPGALLGDVLAQALGLRSLEAALHYLQDKQLLLIFDNCEQIIEESSTLVRMLLTRTRQVHVLATSREPLHLPGESVWRVPSLSSDAAEALFLERVRDHSPYWAPTPEERTAVGMICRRLDGIPLALELAAPLLDALPAVELARRLEGSFLLQLGEAPSAPPRHRTLEAAIRWGTDLLSPEERTLLAQLSVFSGSWSLPAAEAICGDSQLATRLARLVGRSLVVQAEGRYRFLEPIHAFARTLPGADDAALRAHHGNYFAQWATEQLAALRTHGESGALQRLTVEQANLEAALQRSEDTALTVALGLALGKFLRRRGYATGAVLPLEQALAVAPEQAALLCERAAAHLDLQEPEQARVRALQAQAVATSGVEQADALNLLGQAAEQCHDYTQAHADFTEALRLYRAAGEQAGAARLQNNLGYLAFLDPQQDREAAEQALTEALVVLKEVGDQHAVSSALNNQGNLAFLRADWDAAEVAYAASQVREEALGNPLGVARALSNLGEVAQQRGERETALRLFTDAEQRFRELGSPLADYTAQLKEQVA